MKKIIPLSFFTKAKQLLLLIFIGVLFANCQKNQVLTPPKDACLTIDFIGKFPAQINECSGLALQAENLYVINDGGNGAKFYLLNASQLSIIDSFSINEIENKDWEAITTTNTEIIIGDFGNNFGTREDLVIYHLDEQTKQLNSKVEFQYPNQTNFEFSTTHNFDCEAFFIRDNQYYLFSKNRGNSYTYLYTAPLNTNDFSLKDSIGVPALVTDAFYYQEKELVLLLGNELVGNTFNAYLSILRFSNENQLTLVEYLRISEEEQFEAITQKKGNVFYLGSEKERENGGNLYEFTLDGY